MDNRSYNSFLFQHHSKQLNRASEFIVWYPAPFNSSYLQIAFFLTKKKKKKSLCILLTLNNWFNLKKKKIHRPSTDSINWCDDLCCLVSSLSNRRPNPTSFFTSPHCLKFKSSPNNLLLPFLWQPTIHWSLRNWICINDSQALILRLPSPHQKIPSHNSNYQQIQETITAVLLLIFLIRKI